ncbi:MAG: hypothetical protein U0521_06520 [Anaerolineae bacterium]
MTVDRDAPHRDACRFQFSRHVRDRMRRVLQQQQRHVDAVRPERGQQN